MSLLRSPLQRKEEGLQGGGLDPGKKSRYANLRVGALDVLIMSSQIMALKKSTSNMGSKGLS